MSRQPKYKFYASLLDAFQEYMDANPDDYFYQDEQGAWHKNVNDETGEYHLSAEEVDALARQELIDKINRVESEPSEAADKGTAFNEIVDCLIEKRKPSEDIKVTRLCTAPNPVIGSGEAAPVGKPVVYGLRAELDGFVFDYDIAFCLFAAEYFSGSLCQVLTSAPLETKYGVVELYGYADYVRENKVYDLKTTKRYDFGKYEKKWQKHVYPYCFIVNGKCTDIKEFEYTCFKLSGGTSRTPLITGQMFPEVYTFDFEKSKVLLTQHCERLIEFLNENRSLITDKKVFGGEK